MKNVACIIARTNSTRLPRKVLREVGSRTLIEYIIEKIKRARLVDELYLCTSVDEDDQILLELAEKRGIKSYAGSRESIIDRMLDVGEIEGADNLIRITGDNVFTDEVYLDLMLQYHGDNEVDYTRTEHLPIGVTAEVMKTEALAKCRTLMNPDDSQYLLLYLFQPEVFQCQVIVPEERHQRSQMRLTVDSLDDLERTLSIIGNRKELLNLDDILPLCEGGGVPATQYEAGDVIKFPANLSVYYSSFRNEMDLRAQRSREVQLEEGAYQEAFKRQQHV